MCDLATLKTLIHIFYNQFRLDWLGIGESLFFRLKISPSDIRKKEKTWCHVMPF
jgi:hypothetical protein